MCQLHKNSCCCCFLFLEIKMLKRLNDWKSTIYIVKPTSKCVIVCQHDVFFFFLLFFF